ncbi:GAF domain-like protein [Dothidotthia symphoricarpi CBS 119687]|uniref:GAF domain-like protein n=1 Tax=Dothidotthia symphoricarpi CBS 119687 TaxID=1392245 RepID=A0A6A6A7K8_9PLEO|nr:GAF domain-like protein [Dothidotthia symphoricarpi CBS 119687]KAF2126797.1 GAF domain-like protein [Dothidotthia symphoricarpi CBS 119687]
MVHADASAFADGMSKKDVYAQVLEQAHALFDGQRNWVCCCNFSNTSSLLWHAFHSLPAPSNAVNWAGFYFTSPTNAAQLLLGPFQGRVACQAIAFGRGVCGTAASTQTTQLVRDVEAFPGHIACDGQSRSEIVVPVVQGGKVVAIIDVDCAELDGFTEEDQRALEELAKLLAESCDF